MSNIEIEYLFILKHIFMYLTHIMKKEYFFYFPNNISKVVHINSGSIVDKPLHYYVSDTGWITRGGYAIRVPNILALRGELRLLSFRG